MGQSQIKDNIFRNAILYGFMKYGIKVSKNKLYPNSVNYGLIIKPLNLDMKFKFPLMMYFSGVPYHVGIIISTPYDDIVYSFAPDLEQPYRGTIYTDIYQEAPSVWAKDSELCEIFWLMNEKIENDEDMDTYTKITARLIDFLQVNLRQLDLDTYNKRYGLNIKEYYNLFTNNCTTIAISILTGKSICYQIEYLKPIIYQLLKCNDIISQLPNFAIKWLDDYKYINNI